MAILNTQTSNKIYNYVYDNNGSNDINYDKQVGKNVERMLA